MDPPIPLKGVVLFIAFGTMVFIIVFCFIKRQITRFTLRSSHGAHVPIGMDAPKSLRAEIERTLKRAKEISYEPVLLPPVVEEKLTTASTEDPCHYVYRMKAVDALSVLDMELKRCGMPTLRKPGVPLKLYLLDARQNGRPLEGARLDLVEKFANTYEHARHDSSEFTVTHYQEFMNLLHQLLSHIRSKCMSTINLDNADFPSGSGDQAAPFKKTTNQLTGLRAQFTNPSSSESAAAGSDVEMTFQPTQSQQQRIANYTLWSSGQKDSAAATQTKLL